MAILILPILQCITIRGSISIYKSLSKIISQVASLEASVNILYFVFKGDKTIVGCFLDDHDIGIVLMLNTNIVVD